MRCSRLGIDAALLVAVLVPAASCASDEEETRYSADQLLRGIDITAEDPALATESATVFLPDELPSYQLYDPALAEKGIVVIQPGENGYDAIVVYRTGPFCGLLPSVAVAGDEVQLEVAITTNRSGDCDSMEYDEAVGLNLSPGFETSTITARRDG